MTHELEKLQRKGTKPTCPHCHATVLSTSQPNLMGTTPEMQKLYDRFGGEDQFHPGKCLPDCMMPDGGECCPGYVALYDAYWHLVRAAPPASPLLADEPTTFEKVRQIAFGLSAHQQYRLAFLISENI